ncbi:hypothetical protein LQW54_002477 [Pestalotiopsis sp. IQ-011]
MKLQRIASILAATAAAVVARSITLPRTPVLEAFAPVSVEVTSDTHLAIRDFSSKTTAQFSAEDDIRPGLISKRQNPIPEYFVIGDERFGGFRTYSREEISTSITVAMQRLTFNRPTPGNGRGYPHRYYDATNRIRNGATNTGDADVSVLYEYPMISRYSPRQTFPYAGGLPDPDRVIFDRNGNFVTVISHEVVDGNEESVGGYGTRRGSFNGQLTLLGDDAVENWK